MASITAVPVPLQVNPLPVSIHRVRRMCKRHNLRLVKDRSKAGIESAIAERHGVPGWLKMYQLQSSTVVAGANFQLTLQDVIAICERLDGGR